MATIQNAITMNDRMTPVFNKIIRAMQSTLNAMNRLDQASNNGMNSRAFLRAQRDIQSANNELLRFSNNTMHANQQAGRLGAAFGRLGSFNLNVMLNNLRHIYAIFQQIAEVIGSVINRLDEMAQTTARLNMVNDGMQTTKQLQDKILASSNRARMNYDDMAKSVAKLNMLAGDQFKTNDDAINFVETLNKMYAISGSGAQEASAATHQLMQAMSSGRLQGDEFKSIMEQAPMLGQYIADYLKVSKAELKDLSSDGALTADVVKNAMTQATDKINEQFAKMPFTWGQSMIIIKNNTMKIMNEISEKFSTWLNSDSGQKLFNTIQNGFTLMANIALIAIDVITDGIDFLMLALEGLEPFIIAGIVVLSGYLFSLLVPAIVSATTAMWGFATSTMIAGLPIWVVILVIGTLIIVLNQLGVSTGEIIGFIIGIFFAFATFVLNKIIDLINGFIVFANFITNIFENPIGAIKMLFLDMATYVLSTIARVAQGIQDLLNMIPGVSVNLTGGVNNMLKNVQGAKDKVSKDTGVKQAKKMEYKSVSGAFNAGMNLGKNGFEMPKLDFGTNGFSGPGVGVAVPGTGKDGKLKGGKLDKVGKIEDDVKITDEDIKLLKDIATTKFVNSYTTLRPNLSVSFGDVHETADVKKIMNTIENMLEDSLANAIVEV